MAKTKAFIIGDVHGRLARLEALLLEAEIIGPCAVCFASGDVSDGSDEAQFCPACDGNGLMRIDHETEVIQLGDLIDANPQRTSPTADSMIVRFADSWVDTLLWGNHERPIINGPTFDGYGRPDEETLETLAQWRKEGRYKLATHFNDYLITHAGLSDFAFTGERTGSLNRHSAERLACWINLQDEKRPHPNYLAHRDYGDPSNTWPLRDNIGQDRGGWDLWSGLLWRDSREGLWPVPQIFGHTSHRAVIKIEDEKGGSSYCVDTSKHDRVSGIWLPSQEIVTVDDTEDEDDL
jgi:hypothetical protein